MTEVLPNVFDYQLNIMKQTDFFTTLQQKHKLKAVSGDVQQHAVVFTGVPANIEAAQRETLNLLPHLAESKVSEQKKLLFLKVFKTAIAEKSIRQELLAAEKLQATWTVENQTLSVYSVDKSSAVKALKIINEVVWEAHYPQGRELDDPEKKILISGKWNDKKAELCKKFEPLEIVNFNDKTGLGMAGLVHNKGHVLEEISFFFSKNVMRKVVFDNFPEKIYFLVKHNKEVFNELAGKHNVKVTIRADGKSVAIEGTRDDNANFGCSLDKHLKGVFHDFHIIDNRARVQHINDDPEFLETVGWRNNCLVVKHEEGGVEKAVEPEPLSVTSHQTNCLYSVTLPSGTVCEVKRADITSLSHDAIVNAANGDLKHGGGLALAIVQKGGSGIQQECDHYVQKNGKLMEGEVMTSSPGNLSCKKIFHAVGPRWANGRNHEEPTLLNCIDNCFLEAEKEKIHSIAIPPISTGIFKFPMNMAVKAIVGAIEQREKNNEYLPQLISLVDNKSDSLQLFETELRRVFDKAFSQEAAPVKPSNSAKAGPTKSSFSSATGKYTITDNTIKLASGISIELVYGDLVTSQEDTLVNSVGNDMNLSSGKLAVALSNKAGPQLQAACKSLAPIKAGDVKETDGFKLACKKVLHCNCPQWQGPQTAPMSY
ncbi:PARP14 [Bugula neritina]|uniref:PARP14 n=1 Tax=Bugula neritina TaxID=10212 RepID=A0A7J7JLY1_BUGNE|nr:PARP14 [Bugula neritina]